MGRKNSENQTKGVYYLAFKSRIMENIFRQNKSEPQSYNLEEFELTIRGKGNIEEALSAGSALSALGSIKEYLRGIEKWRDWEGKNDAYELIVEIREGVNEIISDLNLSI